MIVFFKKNIVFKRIWFLHEPNPKKNYYSALEVIRKKYDICDDSVYHHMVTIQFSYLGDTDDYEIVLHSPKYMIDLMDISAEIRRTLEVSKS